MAMRSVTIDGAARALWLSRTHLAWATLALLWVGGLSAGARAAERPVPQPAGWADPLFAQPFVDIDEWRDKPVRHRYVHGGFKGTDALFSIYLPPKQKFHGRFFQPIPAISGDENSAQRLSPLVSTAVTQENSTIGFAIDSGGYLVESNLGSKNMYPLPDHTIEGYRTSAAVAQYARKVAGEMYGPGRIYGYAYGGSGGGFKTVSLAENTTGVWDGVVPYVLPSPMASNVFSVQAHAYRILKDKFPAIVDAIDPGGSGNMYAGLNPEEHDALLEATRMGLPPRTWFMYQRLGYGPLAVLIDDWIKWDPGYFEDFWKVPGYLGANPPESLKRAHVQQQTTITRIVMSDEARKMGIPIPMAAWGTNVVPAAIALANLPAVDLKGASLIMKSGGAAGQRLSVTSVVNGLVFIGIGAEAFKYVNSIKTGDELMVDNSIYLAAQTHHRHQVRPRDQNFYVFDQFRGPDGRPLYPQRSVSTSQLMAEQGAGSNQSGKFGGKMIVVETLVDEYASPWNADWYRWKVQQTLGSHIDDSFRLYYIDNAMHGALPYIKSDGTRIAGYLGALQQALRDVSAWVENGVAPPANTRYTMDDGQVVVPATAAQRAGIQPVVTLTVNGGKRADVTVGQPVTFTAVVEAPARTGSIVGAEWDFEGTGDFPVVGQITTPAPRVTVTATYAFVKPGTYFPVLRAASQRQGDTATAYARVRNLDRVRVVVK
jgi:hypothetical protein